MIPVMRGANMTTSYRQLEKVRLSWIFPLSMDTKTMSPSSTDKRIPACIPCLTLALMTCLTCPSGRADDKGSAVTIPNDASNYLGDRVSFDRDLIVSVEGADGKVIGVACLPRRARLIGSTSYVVTATGSNHAESGIRFMTAEPIISAFSGSVFPKDPERACSDADEQIAVTTATQSLPDLTKHLRDAIKPNAKEHYVVRVTLDQVAASPPNRYGLTYGALVVPFKYHMNGKRELTSNASLGPYLGYRTDLGGRGFGLTFIGFLGAGSTSVTTSSSTQSGVTGTTGSGSQSLFSFSYGVGAVATIKGAFQAGLVLGWDHVDKGANYPYNDKSWLAVEVGYAFLH